MHDPFGDDGDAPSWTRVEAEEQRAALLEVLRRSRWLRVLHLIDTRRVDEQGSQRGYDAWGTFQADDLASRPWEVLFGGVISLEVAGAGTASAEAATITRDAAGWHVRLWGASVRCAQLAYRPSPGRPASAPPVH